MDSPNHLYFLQAAPNIDEGMPVPLNETTLTDVLPDIPGAIMSTCGAWCWIYIVLSSLFVGFHFWMMIGPLHGWAKGNFSLISLTVWSLGSFALSMMYVLKVKKFFLMPRWVRLSTWVFEMLYAVYYFCAAVVTTVSWVRGKAMEDTNIEIVLAYLMVLGSPAAVWSTFVTVVEGVSGDLSSEEAREAARERQKYEDAQAQRRQEEKDRAKEVKDEKERRRKQRESEEESGEGLIGGDDHDLQPHGES